ncbi:hypothetical protein PVAP13_9KG640801 [Panicum virgatum]|uniref:Uncharacterized protein n=1 Tax=Panicum virgatum TaxID=38727 RepID=A0A8T0P468_PANVG|nr:hypothetical protein PVAP13_9KG640801 [Panicum virgatum]
MHSLRQLARRSGDFRIYWLALCLMPFWSRALQTGFLLPIFNGGSIPEPEYEMIGANCNCEWSG